MATVDPLLALRQSIAASNLPLATTSTEAPIDNATTDLAKATHLYFTVPRPATISLASPTRFISSDNAVDLRSIFFAWQKKDVAIPDYIASAQELTDSLEGGAKVQNLVFVERLDLITWLEGASDDSEYIKPLEGGTTTADADAAAQIASGAAGGAAAVASGAAPGSRSTKQIDPKLQKIYNGERKLGDRNTVLRGIKATDFSHIRKLAETAFMRRSRQMQSKTAGRAPVQNPSTSMVPSKPSKRPDPIILLSPSASSILRMSNIKSFLDEGMYVPPDHETLATSTPANILYIMRPLPSIDGPGARPTRFIVVDSTTNFKPDYWNRLVAVFTTGQTWQFKSYKWSDPPELFKHVMGVYVGLRGETVPKEVKGWGRAVKSFEVERWDHRAGQNAGGRWRDREVVEGVWASIENSMKGKGWQPR